LLACPSNFRRERGHCDASVMPEIRVVLIAIRGGMLSRDQEVLTRAAFVAAAFQ
jgi:hypothetical protein